MQQIILHSDTFGFVFIHGLPKARICRTIPYQLRFLRSAKQTEILFLIITMDWHNIPLRIIIGNLISFSSSLFLIASCIIREPKKVFVLQTMENIVLSVSSAVLGSYAGISTLLIAAVKNALVAMGRFSFGLMIIFCIVLTAVGLMINNRGIIGLIPIFATVSLTVCNYYTKDILAIKWSLLINIALWSVYGFLIYDFALGTMQIITGIITFISIRRTEKAIREKKYRK